MDICRHGDLLWLFEAYSSVCIKKLTLNISFFFLLFFNTIQNMRIIDKLKERGSFTPAENQIAVFIRDNSRNVVNMPLDQMAEQLYVSKSTIIRFCKKLGFHGHKELCVQLAKELNAFMAADTELDASMPFSRDDNGRIIPDKLAALYYRAVSETYQEVNTDTLQRIGKQIRDKKAVYIYASEENYPAAVSLSMKLQSVGIQVIADSIPGQALKHAAFQPADIPALFISYQTKEPLLNQIASVLTERKIPVILIGGPFAGGLKNCAAETIEISFYEPEPKAAAFGSGIAVMFVLDTLFAGIFCMDFEKNDQIVRNPAEAGKRNGESPESPRNTMK